MSVKCPKCGSKESRINFSLPGTLECLNCKTWYEDTEKRECMSKEELKRLEKRRENDGHLVAK
jgi:hypothetical protein